MAVDPIAGVLFLAAATNSLDVYSAVNSSPWTAENVTAGDPDKEKSLKRYCMHAIGQTIVIDGIAAILANGLWWVVVFGAAIETIYMTYLYWSAVKRGRKTKGANFDDSWAQQQEQEPVSAVVIQDQFTPYHGIAI